MYDIFQLSAVKYNLTYPTVFTRPNINSGHFRTNSLRYMAVKVWDIVHNNVKNVNDIETLKRNIRKWEPENCHCKLCRSCVG